jgi:hypothetical protein
LNSKVRLRADIGDEKWEKEGKRGSCVGRQLLALLRLESCQRAEMDDLRLPTPPPLPPQAPVYSIPFKSDNFPRFATVEYPGPVGNVDAALETVGGLQKLSASLSGESKNPVELDLQPDNPFFHTVPALVTQTRNVVVKITKRRRKRPIVDEAGNVVEEGVFTIEPVGIEHKTVRFRGTFLSFQSYISSSC